MLTPTTWPQHNFTIDGWKAFGPWAYGMAFGGLSYTLRQMAKPDVRRVPDDDVNWERINLKEVTDDGSLGLDDTTRDGCPIRDRVELHAPQFDIPNAEPFRVNGHRAEELPIAHARFQDSIGIASHGPSSHVRRCLGGCVEGPKLSL